MNNIPSIAVIICHYQQIDELAKSLRSIACQYHPPDEIIIVDDGSKEPPNIDAICKVYNLPIRLLLNSINNGGPSIPRNQAVSDCRCSHLIYLDSGDMLLPLTLHTLANIWQKTPFAIVYGDQICWGETIKTPFLQEAGRLTRGLARDQNYTYKQMLMSGNLIFLSGSGGPKELFQLFPFDPDQRWEDFDLWLRLAKAGAKFVHTGSIHSFYHIKSGSRSGSKEARIQGCLDIQRKHLRARPAWRWPLWYWKQRFL